MTSTARARVPSATSAAGETPEQRVLGLITAMWISKAIHAVVELGIPDLLASGGRDVADLAYATQSHEDSLYRLLRGLSAQGIFIEDERRCFRNSEMGEVLRSTVPRSMCGPARFIGMPTGWRAWGELLYTVRTGKCAFEHVAGQDLYSYFEKNPPEAKILNAATTAMAEIESRSIVATYDFSRARVIVDVGGGHGRLLAEILRAYPAARGVLFEMAHALDGAVRLLSEHGVMDRVKIVVGDAFNAVHPGGDLYIMKKVINDWDDERSIRLMRACSAAMPAGAKLLLAERVLGPRNAADYAKIWDLNLMVVAGGRERTADEYRELYRAAGLRMTGEFPTGGSMTVLEGEAPNGC